MGTEEPETRRRRERLATLGVVVLAVITAVLVVLALEHTSKASADATSSYPVIGAARPHSGAAP